ncbi:ATP-binding protein [Nocardia cyriacigeorgica]|uniref:ATP-binding protein n=1 Tax=Nocardia cyriacigeorgica TaxID=135487 RepID=A0A5R8P986_9NOCA|nr:ATP-binding protein [Nocardia cyriacigeorgica]TLG03320.1 ATP-binding protein [Nocardia cyriacigeorgica]
MTLPNKPSRVFDRDKEWEGLARFATSSSPDVRLGIVSGRRRQGKTFLLDALAETVGGFFFTATEATEIETLDRFGRAVAEFAGGGRYTFTDWDEALERLCAVVGDGLVVIDEFPYLSKATPSLPSVLQRALDPRGYARAAGSRFLLCGSAMSVMGKLLSGSAPLRGRASMELVVKPLEYREAAAFWGIDDPRLAVLVHSIVGGTPAYRREFVAGDSPASAADFDAWVLRTVLNPQVPLFREARYLLAEETDIRDVALYHAVLGAIATGNTTRGGISNAIGRNSTDIAHPLAVLEDSQLVHRTIDPFTKGKSTYRIAEPLIVFYEAIMRRQWTLLERGNPEGAWRNAQSTFSAQVVGPHFEGICRDWAMTAGPEVFGELPGHVAAATVNDPAERAQIQVDVAVLAPEAPGEPRRILSLGEAKWDRTMTIGHVNRLRRARDLLAAKGLDTSETVLTCYSGSGFDQNLRESGEAMLVGLNDLYS